MVHTTNLAAYDGPFGTFGDDFETAPIHARNRALERWWFPILPPVPDSLAAWIAHYPRRAVAGVRAHLVAAKIALHLERFQVYFAQTWGANIFRGKIRAKEL